MELFIIYVIFLRRHLMNFPYLPKPLYHAMSIAYVATWADIRHRKQ